MSLVFGGGMVMFLLFIRHFFLVLLELCGFRTLAAPPDFPLSGNGLWYTQPADKRWAKTWLPVGNGYLAATTPGGTWVETTQVNIESLWTGGPFSVPTYNGGNGEPNEQADMATEMLRIRQTIFDSPNAEIDNIDKLLPDAAGYGSYASAGFFISSIDASGTISGYSRFLDMDSGLTKTIWTAVGTTYTRETFCSHPVKSCLHHVSSSPARPLPTTTFAWTNTLSPVPNVTCIDSHTLSIRGYASSPGMIYEILARVRTSDTSARVHVTCVATRGSGSPTNATITVTGASDAWIAWVGDTEYSTSAGDAAHGFSFRGQDPHPNLISLISAPALSEAPYEDILHRHLTDWNAFFDGFSISLGHTPNRDTPTDVLKANYRVDVGDPYVEWLTFNLGMYMIAGSARGGLPANLQGKWAMWDSNPWSADYHANINLQMNYWAVDMLGFDVQKPLFDFIEKTWAPRGSYTAKVLYNITRGWVTHDEMNLFGHTGMHGNGNKPEWINFPEANAWMMIHVWDYFDYTGDVAWFKRQGYPLLKGTALFHLDKLLPDQHLQDGTLVVNPCNSPVQSPITYGCAISQQLIWQLFNAVEKGFDIAGDKDVSFLDEIKEKKAKMDKGIRIGSWGQLQEWKVEKDSPSDTHRHLSHLAGLYPGYAIASYDPTLQGNQIVDGTPVYYTKDQVISAARVSLAHRGNGTAPGSDTGWEKVWRAAAWAQLGDSEMFYKELTYAIDRNFGPNLWSLYDSSVEDAWFQIDANLGFPAAVMNALIQAPDVASFASPLIVTVFPALPRQWPTGKVKGARVRGGMVTDLEWKDGRPVLVSITSSRSSKTLPPRWVKILYGGKILGQFESGPGVEEIFREF